MKSIVRICASLCQHTSTPCFEASTKEAVCTLPETIDTETNITHTDIYIYIYIILIENEGWKNTWFLFLDETWTVFSLFRFGERVCFAVPFAGHRWDFCESSEPP